VLSLSLHHLFRTFQFINTSPFENQAFVLKSQVALNELEPNSIDIMYSSIKDKYINCPNQYKSLSLIEFSFFLALKKLRFQKIVNPKLLGL